MGRPDHVTPDHDHSFFDILLGGGFSFWFVDRVGFISPNPLSSTLLMMHDVVFLGRGFVCLMSGLLLFCYI